MSDRGGSAFAGRGSSHSGRRPKWAAASSAPSTQSRARSFSSPWPLLATILSLCCATGVRGGFGGLTLGKAPFKTERRDKFVQALELTEKRFQKGDFRAPMEFVAEGHGFVGWGGKEAACLADMCLGLLEHLYEPGGDLPPLHTLRTEVVNCCMIGIQENANGLGKEWCTSNLARPYEALTEVLESASSIALPVDLRKAPDESRRTTEEENQTARLEPGPQKLLEAFRDLQIGTKQAFDVSRQPYTTAIDVLLSRCADLPASVEETELVNCVRELREDVKKHLEAGREPAPKFRRDEL